MLYIVRKTVRIKRLSHHENRVFVFNENISRASGASHGQETTDHEFINLIKENNKKPYLRNTLYTKLKKVEELSLEEDVIKI